MLYNTVTVCTVVVLFFVVSLELDLVLPDRLKPALFPNNLCIFPAHTKTNKLLSYTQPSNSGSNFFHMALRIGQVDK